MNQSNLTALVVCTPRARRQAMVYPDQGFIFPSDHQCLRSPEYVWRVVALYKAV